jgi:hypothetical protein
MRVAYRSGDAQQLGAVSRIYLVSDTDISR